MSYHFISLVKINSTCMEKALIFCMFFSKPLATTKCLKCELGLGVFF
jgi:hypothetical protein